MFSGGRCVPKAPRCKEDEQQEQPTHGPPSRTDYIAAIEHLLAGWRGGWRLGAPANAAALTVRPVAEPTQPGALRQAAGRQGTHRAAEPCRARPARGADAVGSSKGSPRPNHIAPPHAPGGRRRATRLAARGCGSWAADQRLFAR